MNDIESVPEPAAATRAKILFLTARPRRSRKIVFVGNCQVQSLKSIYDRFVLPWSDDETIYVDAYKAITSEHLTAVGSADIVVGQMADWGSGVNLDNLPSSTVRYMVPVVTAGFLWPFAGQPHPRNAPTYFWPAGPYPGELGDSYLNRMIAKGSLPEEAVERYATLDVNKIINLDRLLEITIEKQKRRDAATDFETADAMLSWFRDEHIFFTPYHPGLRFTKHLASQFLEQIGAGTEALARMQEGLRLSPFPREELPIHPNVGKHYGLSYLNDKQKFRYLNEDNFTFDEYALRYMNFEWNSDLAEGLYLFQNQSPDRALDLLSSALKKSPNSAAGHYAMGILLAQFGDLDGGLESLQLAVNLDPGDAHARARLGGLLADRGDLAGGERELRSAVSLEPAVVGFQVSLAGLLTRLGRNEEALQTLRYVAASVDPKNSHCYGRMSQVLEREGRLDEAIEAEKQSIVFESDNPHSHAHLGGMLARKGQLDDAEMEYRTAVELDPLSPPFLRGLSGVLARQGRIGDAIEVAAEALALAPENGDIRVWLDELSSRLGEQEARMQASDSQARSQAINHAATNVVIDFSAGGNGLSLLEEGWSGQEPGHIWAVGRQSTLRIPALAANNSYHFELDVGACIQPPEILEGELRVATAGISLGVFRPSQRTKIEFDLQRELISQGGDLVLLFEHPDCVRPADYGHPDTRELAVCFWRIEISPLVDLEAQRVDTGETLTIPYDADPASDPINGRSGPSEAGNGHSRVDGAAPGAGSGNGVAQIYAADPTTFQRPRLGLPVSKPEITQLWTRLVTIGKKALRTDKPEG